MAPGGAWTFGEETIVAWENRLLRLLRARELAGITLRRFVRLTIQIRILTFLLARYADGTPWHHAETDDEEPLDVTGPQEFVYPPGPPSRRPVRRGRHLRLLLHRIAEANDAWRAPVGQSWN